MNLFIPMAVVTIVWAGCVYCVIARAMSILSESEASNED